MRRLLSTEPRPNVDDSGLAHYEGKEGHVPIEPCFFPVTAEAKKAASWGERIVRDPHTKQRLIPATLAERRTFAEESCLQCAIRLSPTDEANGPGLLRDTESIEEQVVDAFMTSGLRRWHRGLSHADRNQIAKRYELRSVADLVVPQPVLIQMAQALEDGDYFITLGVNDRREISVLAAYLDENEMITIQMQLPEGPTPTVVECYITLALPQHQGYESHPWLRRLCKPRGVFVGPGCAK